MNEPGWYQRPETVFAITAAVSQSDLQAAAEDLQGSAAWASIVLAVVLSAFYCLARWMRGRPAAASYLAAAGRRVKAQKPSSEWPIVTAFVIWFVYFMVIWAAGEIWPHQWAANALACGVTAIALGAVGVRHGRLISRHAEGGLSDWSYRFAKGAAAIATAAVLFSALPFVVQLP